MKVTVEMEENCELYTWEGEKILYVLINSEDFLHCDWLTYDTACQMHEVELTFRVKHSGHCLVSTLRD